MPSTGRNTVHFSAVISKLRHACAEMLRRMRLTIIACCSSNISSSFEIHVMMVSVFQQNYPRGRCEAPGESGAPSWRRRKCKGQRQKMVEKEQPDLRRTADVQRASVDWRRKHGLWGKEVSCSCEPWFCSGESFLVVCGEVGTVKSRALMAGAR